MVKVLASTLGVLIYFFSPNPTQFLAWPHKHTRRGPEAPNEHSGKTHSLGHGKPVCKFIVDVYRVQ